MTTPDLFSPRAPAVATPTRFAGPCTRPGPGLYVCRVGGGDAAMTDDGGRTWFCAAHAPRGFFPGDRS